MLVAYSRGRRRAVLLESLSPEGGRPRSASVCLGFTKAEAAALPGLIKHGVVGVLAGNARAGCRGGTRSSEI